MLVRACAGMWHYDVIRGGAVERDAPAKNERLFVDLGDALCYAVGEMQPSRLQRRSERPKTTKTSFSPVQLCGLHEETYRMKTVVKPLPRK
jgi:hypothetical protein